VLQHATRLRCAALLSAGALSVHELRYLLAFGDGTSHALALQGHGYLVAAPPLLAGLLALAGAQLLMLLARPATRGAAGRRPVPLLRRRPARFARGAAAHPRLAAWLGSSAVLLAAYVAQETLEGALAPGHPAGLAGVLGAGGWLAIPASLVVGAVVALLLHGARAVLDARPADPRAPHWARAAIPAPPAFAFPHRSLVSPGRGLARHLAGRAPPAPVRSI
jgi:hypothetical protein